jgi:hypothetical protein
MASTYIAGLVPTAPAFVAGGLRLDPKRLGLALPEVGSVTTYFYRTSGGTRGSTTDAAAIPAGAVVERVT